MTETVVPALGIDLGTTNSAAAVILGDEVMLNFPERSISSYALMAKVRWSNPM